MGRIGLAISPADPDTVYARRSRPPNKAGGIFRSTDRGETWDKRSDYVPGRADVLPARSSSTRRTATASTRWTSSCKVSDDGGKTFRNLGETRQARRQPRDLDRPGRHRPLPGRAATAASTRASTARRHLATSRRTCRSRSSTTSRWTTRSPFYNVYGGTQDNYSLGGPSRTLNVHGITNPDWFVTWGGDGFQRRVDPKDPNIVYCPARSTASSCRFDRQSGEAIAHPAAGGPGRRARCAGTGTARSRSARTSTRASTSRRSGSSAATTAATPGRRSARDLTRQHRPQQAEGDGQGLGARRGREEPVDVLLRQHRRARRVAARGGPALRRHRRRPRAGHRGRRRELAQGRRRSPACRRAPTSASSLASQHDANMVYAALRQPQERRLQALPAAERRPRQDVGARSPATCPRAAASWAVAEDPVDRDLLFAGTEFGLFFTPRRREEVDPAQGRAADDRRPRPRDPEARGRPRGRRRSAAASTSSTTTRRCALTRPADLEQEALAVSR